MKLKIVAVILLVTALITCVWFSSDAAKPEVCSAPTDNNLEFCNRVFNNYYSFAKYSSLIKAKAFMTLDGMTYTVPFEISLKSDVSDISNPKLEYGCEFGLLDVFNCTTRYTLCDGYLYSYKNGKQTAHVTDRCEGAAFTDKFEFSSLRPSSTTKLNVTKDEDKTKVQYLLGVDARLLGLESVFDTSITNTLINCEITLLVSKDEHIEQINIFCKYSGRINGRPTNAKIYYTVYPDYTGTVNILPPKNKDEYTVK